MQSANQIVGLAKRIMQLAEQIRCFDALNYNSAGRKMCSATLIRYMAIQIVKAANQIIHIVERIVEADAQIMHMDQPIFSIDGVKNQIYKY